MAVVEQVCVWVLDKRCMLDVRSEQEKLRGGFAFSDCCQQPATTVVVMPNGNLAPRCPEHRGIVRIQYGEVRETMPVTVTD